MATILFSLAGSCIQKLQEIITEEAIQILGVKQELRDLQQTMTQIQYFLKDADRRRIEDSAVSNLLGELNDAMYDADDVIDLARFKGIKLLGDYPSSSTSRKLACNGFPLISCFSSIHTRHVIAVKIRSINKRIEMIRELLTKFKSEKPVGNISLSNRRKTSHLVEPNLVGNEIIRSTTRLVELVLEHREMKAYKIAITGTGGVGKTTLAQKLYNDQRVKGNFKKHAWICVSQQYSEVALLKEILRNIGVNQEQGESVGELLAKFAEAIEGKSFFLVLDDLWQADIWTNLVRTPLHAASQATIVVTTRDDRVAKAMMVTHVHRVELMSEEVGWELLLKSMNINDENQVHNLKATGKEIVRKCGGLPLAIRVIASVLATKARTEIGWQSILSNDAWSMAKLPDELRGALYLSYDQLPQNLKQCFLYCALYPEDWTMYRDEIIRFWVAEGFVEKHENQLMEDTAQEYYYQLIERNLLLPKPEYFDQDRCKMHDLLRQLGHYISRDECFIGDPKSLEGKSISKLRRVSVTTDNAMVVLPNLDKKELRVRTFINVCSKSPKMDNSLFNRLLYVRILDLSWSDLQNIPDYIGSLIHLRLLSLDHTGITCLPESIGSLKNLQTLNLQFCTTFHSLPFAVTRLWSLRRLGLKGTPINQVPKGIDRLEYLNDLEGFPISDSSFNSSRMQDGWNLEELGPLLQLRRLLIVKLERAAPRSANALLIDKRHLKFLKLLCTENTDEPCSIEDVNNIEKIFEQLIPSTSLEKLTIERFFGQRYPTWLSTGHLSSMELLHLINCKSCLHLPAIGQLPNLRYLKINRATAVTKIGPEFSGPGVVNTESAEVVAFPKLETLVFEDMPNWKEWTFNVVEEAPIIRKEVKDDQAVRKKIGEISHRRMHLLPCLKELVLVGCPKLKALPEQLGEMATNLKELLLKDLGRLKVVEDLPFLAEELVIAGCKGLAKVLNLCQVRRLNVQLCPNLRCVEKLDNLQQLFMTEDMQKVSLLWLPGLQEQCQRHHCKNLEVYNW